MYGLKRSKQDGSGVIKGAGTGTSDDIQKNVPAGTYIMPADSTQKLGARNIKNLGQPSVPVNVSNGEYELPPEQVHAVGVQALNQMKDATHTDVPEQQGFGLKPKLFFANGGVVPSSPYPSADDIRRAQQDRLNGPQMRDVQPIERQLPASNTTTPSNGNVKFPQFNTPTTGQMLKSTAANVAKGTGRLGTVGALGSTAFAVANTPTEQYRERFGLGDYNPDDSNGMRFAKDLGVRAIGAASDLGNAMTLGLASKLYTDRQRIDQEAKAAQPAFNQQQNNNSKTVSNPFNGSASTTLNTQAAPVQTQPAVRQNADPYAIKQKGNSFSYSNPAAAANAHANGIPELATSGFANVKPINDPRGVANMFANTREMGPNDQQIQNALAQREASLGNGGGFGARTYSLGESSQAADTLQKRIDAVSQPLPGSRGLTASQRNQIVELQNGFDNRANDVYKTDANNAAALQREAMGQAGANYRADLQEGGQNNRYFAGLAQDTQKFNADFGLRNRQMNLTETKEGFGIRNAARIESFQNQYDAAKTDEERQSIMQKIQRYSGGGDQSVSGKDRFITVGGGQVYDKENGLINQPQRLFDTKTQQYVNTGNNSSSGRAVGTISKVGDKTAVWDGAKWVPQ
ncbi:hypothetical protein [Acinetobacter sp. ANC 4193]